MPNGKPGDHPATDIANHGWKVFTPEMDELIVDIHRSTTDYASFDPFGSDLDFLMMKARNDQSLWPELEQRLRERWAEIRR